MAGMRGDDREPDAMFSDVSAEQRVPRLTPRFNDVRRREIAIVIRFSAAS
jgi:hypothetical protein